MLIADDEPDIRALMVQVLRTADVEIVGEAADAEQTIALWRTHRPDVVVLDHKMPPTSGFDVAKEILTEHPDQVIVLFTAFVDADVRAKAKQVGITVCVSKDRVFDIPDVMREHVNRA
ncbi:MAG TPA: response regulator transcription factor [Acidimicrobiales bacterium]|nr:response regulator transcription factor [Acidimicrobiales bacterium]